MKMRKCLQNNFHHQKRKLFSISTEQIEVKCECHDGDDGICNISLYYRIQQQKGKLRVKA